METSPSLATDSFSYSWLSDSKPPLDDLASEPLRLSIYSSYQNFNFDVSSLQSPPVLAHADELFSNGLIRPVFVDPLKGESYNYTPDSTKTMSGSSSFSSATVPARTGGINHGFLKKWRRSARQSLRDLFRRLNRFRYKLGWSRKSTRVGNIDKAVEWEGSPKIGADCDNENSIHEAVLHCKRSSAK